MDLKNKKCLILGFGREGKAGLKYLLAQGCSEIAVADQALRQEETLAYPEVHTWFSDERWLGQVDSYDVVYKSPGIPFRYVKNFKGALLSATQIFLEQKRDHTIAITGTKGKSTSATLLYHILKEMGVSVVLGGNIGVPPLDMLEMKADLFILELSSYQLEPISISPKIGVILNIFPDHLDHHESFDAYRKAKARIGAFQRRQDTIILPYGKREDFSSLINEVSLNSDKAEKEEVQKIYFGSKNTRDSSVYLDGTSILIRDIDDGGKINEFVLCEQAETTLRGKGMLDNLCAVLECLFALRKYGHISDIPWDSVRSSLKSFSLLPHRLQEIHSVSGIVFVNDSISTIPEATINAIDVYKDTIETLILGGYDRGIPYTVLYEYLSLTTIKNIFFIPPAGARMKKEIMENFSVLLDKSACIEVPDLQTAVSLAKSSTSQGKVCLLSPAAPSFGPFKNFEERGEVFMNLVRGL